MKSSVVKRSVVLDSGRKSSVSLEQKFWDGLGAMAAELGTTKIAIIRDVDADRRDSNLSSAVRVRIFSFYCAKAERLETSVAGTEREAAKMNSGTLASSIGGAEMPSSRTPRPVASDVRHDSISHSIERSGS